MRQGQDEFSALGWAGIDGLPFQLDERAGDLLVWHRGFLLGHWPWHTHYQVDEKGGLHLLDLVRQRWFREFPAGSWTTVCRAPHP